MSDIISNSQLERDMTDNFVCVIYFRDHNEADVRANGMEPMRIWEILRYHAFHENVVPVILDQLISNNERRGFVRYNPDNGRVLLTDSGRHWAENNCQTRAGVTG